MAKVKNFFQGMSTKQVIALIILAAADVFVIAAPYYLKNIIPNLHQHLGIREDQVAVLTSIIGWVTLATQLPGGFLANKFSSRWLLFYAVLSTGFITFWFGATILQSPNLSPDSLMLQYGFIFALWGVSSTLIFWTPLWKLVSQQTTKENQGFAYGFQGTANGVLGFVLVFGIGLIVTNVWSPLVENTTSSSLPFSVYAFLLAGFLVATSFLVLFMVPEKPLEKSKEKLSRSLIGRNIKQVGRSLKNWKLWMLSIFLMGMYTFQSVFAFYLLQMITNAFLAPLVLATVVGGIRTYAMRTAVSAFVGKFADKFKSYILLLLITTGIGIVLIGILILLPLVNGNQIQQSIPLVVISTIIFLLAGFLSWVMVTLRYAQVGEIEIEKNSYASSIGVLSFIGFSTDAWLYNITGAIGESFTDKVSGDTTTSMLGYQLILVVTLSIALLGVICGLIVHIANTRELKRLGKTDYRWRALDNA